MAYEWKRFKLSFHTYKIASGLKNKIKALQSLLHVIVYEVVECFKIHFSGQKKNVTNVAHISIQLKAY